MKKTKTKPVIVALDYPDETRIEARIPIWKAYAIMAELERDEEIRRFSESKKKKE